MTHHKDKGTLLWHVLGGNNKHQIGGNSGLCTYDYIDADGKACRKTLLFDAGVLLASGHWLEDPALDDCDTVLPDYARFLYNKEDPSHVPETPIDSIFLTHNHPDHMAALPLLLLMGYKLPKIYTTPYTAKRLEQELSNAGLDPQEWPEIFMVAPGKPVVEGPVSVTSFWVSHSTPQSVGFFIETPAGTILNPGDFKLDPSVIWGPAFDENQFKRVVSQPVDLLLLDSTGAQQDGPTLTEHDMRETLRELMEENPNKRFVVAVMGGYEENLASVAQVTAEYERTLWVSGTAHEQALDALAANGMSLGEQLGADLEVRTLTPGKSARDLAACRPKDSVIVVTGAQGHTNAVLTRAAEDRSTALTLNPRTDIILICAPVMPGQEAQRQRLLSTLAAKGFKVLTREDDILYSHAHARLPEIVEFVKLADPKCVMPVHGNVAQRSACEKAMQKMGKKTVGANNGDVMRVTKQGVHSVNPPTKDKAPLVGLKTLQGKTWDDRYYVMVTAPAKKPQLPANNNAPGPKKHRPRIFKPGAP